MIPDPTLTLFNGAVGPDFKPLRAGAGTRRITAAGNAVPVSSALKDPASKDSAVLLTLAPGAYTVQAASASAQAGTVLLEVYEVQ